MTNDERRSRRDEALTPDRADRPPIADQPGVVGRHLDRNEVEDIADERGGRQPLGHMGDTLPPETQHRQMAERISRGPGDDVSSYGDDLGTRGGDVGVLGGDPAGGPAGRAGQASRSYGNDSSAVGGLGGRAARNIGGLPGSAGSLGGVAGAHAAGQGSGVDAGVPDPSVLSADEDAGRTARDAARPSDEPVDQHPSGNPVVSERASRRPQGGRRSSIKTGADPRLGDDLDQIGDPTSQRT